MKIRFITSFPSFFSRLTFVSYFERQRKTRKKKYAEGILYFKAQKWNVELKITVYSFHYFWMLRFCCHLSIALFQDIFFLSKALFFDSKQFILPSSSHLLHLIKANFCMKILKKVTKTLMRNIQKKTRNLTKT